MFVLQTYALQGLLVWNPFRTIQPDPQTVQETLVNSNTPPAGSTHAITSA